MSDQKENVVIACFFRGSAMSSSRAYPLWIEEQIKKRCECVADRVIYLDIGGEDMLMFPNIGNRSKKISEILTQIITENICMSEISDYMRNRINNIMVRISNFRLRQVSVSSRSIVKKVNCKGIILLGYSRGAVSAYMVGAELSQSLNIPVSIIANEPVPGNTGVFSKFSNSVYQKSRNLNLSKVHSVVTILGNYKACLGYQQMMPDGLLYAENSNILLIDKLGHACTNSFYGQFYLEMIICYSCLFLEQNVNFKNLIEDRIDIYKDIFKKFDQADFDVKGLNDLFKEKEIKPKGNIFYNNSARHKVGGSIEKQLCVVTNFEAFEKKTTAIL